MSASVLERPPSPQTPADELDTLVRSLVDALPPLDDEARRELGRLLA